MRRRTLEQIIGPIPAALQLALNAHAIVSVADRRGDIVYANDLFCQISGYSEAELLGRNHRIVRSDEHSAEFYKLLWKTITAGDVWNGEIRNRRRDGSSYWVASTIVPVEGARGEISHYISIRTDITETKRQSLMLARTNQQMELVLRESGTEICRYDIESDRLETLAGPSEATSRFKNIPYSKLIYLAHDREGVSALIDARKFPGRSVVVASRDIDTGTLSRWNRFGFSSPYVENNRQYQLMYRIPVDDLVRVQKTLESALSFADMTLFERSLDTGEGHFVYNRDKRKQFIPYEPWLEMMLPQYRDKYRTEMTGEGGTLEYEIHLSPNSLESSWIRESIIGTYKDSTGQTLQLGLSQDIQAEKIKSLALEHQNLELSRLSDGNRRMFAVIGHELKTPLVAASMMLADDAIASDPVHQREIKASIDHALSLIDQLREMIQPEQLVERKSLRDIDLLELVEGIIASQRATFGDAVNIHLKEGWLPAKMVRINQVAVRQILLNLIRNAAIHAKPTDIWVTLYASENFSIPGKYQIVLVVEDNGPGIATDKQHSLFDAFVQGGEGHEGTGLGLYICRDSAKSMEGDLIYRDRLEGGAQFIFSFQARAIDASVPLETVLQEQQVLRGLSILFAEDAPTLQLITKKMLEQAGAHVSVAGDGLEALQLVQEHPFDLILTDLHMPHLDGLGLTAALRERGFNQPIFAVTAAMSEADRVALLSAGANAVLTKPLSSEKLLSALKSRS